MRRVERTEIVIGAALMAAAAVLALMDRMRRKRFGNCREPGRFRLIRPDGFLYKHLEDKMYTDDGKVSRRWKG